MKLGRFDLQIVSDGAFRLDGGAMFGVVPKPLWARVAPADERNRIRMGTNCLLVRSDQGTVLVDTGIGDKHDEKFRDIYGMDDAERRLPEALASAGVDPAEISHVLLTHLHFDHCGWNTRERGGRLVPTFPEARYWIERGELEHARAPSERDRASYFGDNWEPLIEAGVVELFDDEAEVVPGVRAVKAAGHNRDMCVVTLDGGDGEHGIFLADLVPTTAHVPYPWIMSYDLYPLTTLENKKIWLPRAAAGGWLGVFEHDPEVAFARIVEEKPGRFRSEPLDEPARAGR